MSVVAGDGWFGRESQGRDAWRWSAGRGELALHVDAPRGAARATLRIGLRSVSARTVTVRLGERVLWQGAVGERMTAVTLADVELRAGVTMVSVESAEPPVKEAADPGARALAFAIYNLRVE